MYKNFRFSHREINIDKTEFNKNFQKQLETCKKAQVLKNSYLNLLR